MLVLTMFGLLIQVCFMAIASLHDLRQPVVPFLKLYGLAYLGYGVAVTHLLRRPVRRRAFPLILGLAVLFRVTLLFSSPPTLSDDVYRYVWDGRLTNAGGNSKALTP